MATMVRFDPFRELTTLQVEMGKAMGGVFSERDTHFRISYAASVETLRRGAEVLCKLAREMKQA